MTKAAYMQEYGLILRPLTQEEIIEAKTDYQKNASFMIVCKSHIAEWYSEKGTMKDLREYVKHHHITKWKYVH